MGVRPGNRGPSSTNSYAGKFLAYSMRADASLAKRRACSAEFISVNGQCSVRSALGSDMRQSKRISGHVAATVPPHAPMNSPVRHLAAGFGF